MADQGNITTPNAADLDAAARKYAASQGWAMPDGSYPIRPIDNHGRNDLDAALHAVGRGSGDHDAIRRHIITRAKALGLSDLIPDNWNGDGSLRGVSNMDVERRYTPGIVQFRADPGQDTLGGYAAVFDKLSRNLGGFVERVAPTAFNESRMAGWPDVLARYNHDDMMLLGTTAAGTLRLNVDSSGLDYSVLPPASRSDITELVKRGDVRNSSFAFYVMPSGDEWATTDQGYPMRTLQAVRLVDVAPVVSPAYPDASVGLRSLAAAKDAPLDDIRKLAREDDLRRLFVRTDTESTKTPAKRIFGPAAAVQLLARKQDPYA